MTPANPADIEWRGTFPRYDTVVGGLWIVFAIVAAVIVKVLL